MIKSTSNNRQKAVNAALGSVRAEGLKPSKNVVKSLNSYADGKTSLSKVRKDTELRVSNATHAIR